MGFQLTITLLLAGILAGTVNFFVNYLGLPFQSQSLLTDEDWPKPKTVWLAISGYIIVGIAGALLTPLINAISPLKGYGDSAKDLIVIFGYGIVFGYSTNRLLISILNSVIKKISNIEAKVKELTKVIERDNNSGVSLLADELKLGQHYPSNKTEIQACDEMKAKIVRGDNAFKALIENKNVDIYFKDEEGTGADRMMNAKLNAAINNLATKVKEKEEWKIGSNPKFKLRITEAWDEGDEHAEKSLHYEARAADINLLEISNNTVNTSNLGVLSALAIDSGFDWIWYEDSSHLHVSCKK